MIVRGLFHLHTRVSKDATLTHEDHTAHARSNGLSFLLFAEHRETMTPEEVRAAAERCDALSTDDLLLVPGQEQQTEPLGLHVIGAGVREPLEAVEPRSVVDEIRERGGVSVLAHPFRYRRKTRDPLFLAALAALDGIEGYNLRYDGRAGVREEVRSLVASRPDAVAVAGLDAHDPEDLAHPDEPVLVVDAERLEERALLGAIGAGRFTLESGGRPLDLRRAAPLASKVAATLHRGVFAVARGAKRGLARVGLSPPEAWVRRMRRRF